MAGKPKFDKTDKPELFAKDRRAIDNKHEKIQEFRRDVSRKASIANKRIARLEKNGLTDNPAYKKYVADGKVKFGVKGKSYNEVQAELSRLNRFIESGSSTIRGTNSILKEMADNTGIKYKNLQELREKSSKFFELASKTEQYLRTVDDMASAIGYQQIWEAINQYTDQADTGLDGSLDDVDSMVENIANALKEYDDPADIWGGIGFYSVKKDDI